MGPDTLTPATPATDEELDLVALTPAHLAETQAHLANWCVHKQRALEQELADLSEHRLIATANGWDLRGMNASIRRTERRIDYYTKVEAAVREGYLIVPNFPITLLAVRVDAKRPRWRRADSTWSSRFDAEPKLLPKGEGRYVDERIEVVDNSYTQEIPGKEPKIISNYTSGDYLEPDFPYQLVKPAVITATERAMRLSVFDTIGMVENRVKGDPIMVGQILDPRGNDRRCTFFIAWWLNTRSL